MSQDPKQGVALKASLDEADRQYLHGDYEAALTGADAVLRGLEAADAASPTLQRGALMLRVQSLSKLERFDAMLEACSQVLNLLPLYEASVERAELMVLMAFGYVNLGMSEQSLRAAHVALQDGLQLQNPTLASRALDRTAMAYLSMGDGLEAERFMVEAVGFSEHLSSAQERLSRYSNALHLFCSLHDAYAEVDRRQMASGVLARAARLLGQGDALLVEVDSPHMRCMWRANQARWRRRRGEREPARVALRAVLVESLAQHWHSIRRSVQLELALMDAEVGDAASALELLQALFEPAELRVRDRVALRALTLMVQLYAALNQVEQAAQAGEELARRQAERAAAVARAHAQLAGLGARILDALVEADRARVDEEIRRLRDLRAEGGAVGRTWGTAAGLQ
ncbi:hypothetical protein [Paucibacter soli]|uniref:hypothetical protein n=1 Tax=Paucibacter soli TaxID=3133433 RepID=UPI0030992A1F